MSTTPERTPPAAQLAMREAFGRAMTATVAERVRGKARDEALALMRAFGLDVEGLTPTRERELSKFELRVLLALGSLVALYDRAEDTVANRQIVEFLGGDVDDKSLQREVRRALDSLNSAGVIRRVPGSGRMASRVIFPPSTEGGTAPQAQGGTSPPAERGAEQTREGYSAHRGRGTGTPHPTTHRDLSVAATSCDECGAKPGDHHGMVDFGNLGAVRCPNALRRAS